MINNTDLQNKVKEKWEQLCKIHSMTKKYMLLSEEYSIDMKTYVQPIKEQRDAYEHLVRAYTKYYDVNIPPIFNNSTESLENSNIGNEEYILKNLDKAISHEFRAYYDAIDYITLVLRNLFYNELKDFSYNDIVSVFSGYPELKSQLLSLPEQIAEQRNKKDIGNSAQIQIAEDYGKIADDLFEKYKSLVENVLNKIEPV